MNSRRKFLIQGSMATAAVLALKPFSSLANTSTYSGLSSHSNKLVFIHTTCSQAEEYKVIRYMSSFKTENKNAILLNAGQNLQNPTEEPASDVSEINSDYKIITKGTIRTGVINANPGEENIYDKINSLSALLKNEKNCAVVVCVSQLGYKNDNKPDDLTLAKKSANLDIIIGGHPDNFHNLPVIALNNVHSEVIIHSASGNDKGCGVIDIDFDGEKRKKSIAIR